MKHNELIYEPQWHPANHTSLLLVGFPLLWLCFFSRCFKEACLCNLGFFESLSLALGTEPLARLASSGTWVVSISDCDAASSSLFSLRFQRLALNLARRSSRETAWRKVWTMVLLVVKGKRRGKRPTEFTVSDKDKP